MGTTARRTVDGRLRRNKRRTAAKDRRCPKGENTGSSYPALRNEEANMEINDLLDHSLGYSSSHFYSRPHPYSFNDNATGRGRRLTGYLGAVRSGYTCLRGWQ